MSDHGVISQEGGCGRARTAPRAKMHACALTRKRACIRGWLRYPAGTLLGPREPNLAFAKSHLGCVKPQKRDRVVGGRFLAVNGECGREK